MKKQIIFLTTVFASAFFTSLFAQTDPGLTLVTDLSSKGAFQITLHLEGNVEVAFWDKEYLQMEIRVQESNLSRQQLKSLVSMGFFKVETLGGKAGIALNMPGQLLPLTVNGMKPKNKLAFKITVPRYAEIIRPGKAQEILAKN